MDLRSTIRTIPDFPKSGIQFRDITTLLHNAEAFNFVVNEFATRYAPMGIDRICGIESRGFIFGGALAHQLRVGFVPIRKKGKLPAKTEGVEYALEYGTDRVEIHTDAIQRGNRILLLDDLIATGGTAAASSALIEKLGGTIVECAFVIELPDLGGRQKLAPRSVYSLVSFSGH